MRVWVIVAFAFLVVGCAHSRELAYERSPEVSAERLLSSKAAYQQLVEYRDGLARAGEDAAAEHVSRDLEHASLLLKRCEQLVIAQPLGGQADLYLDTLEGQLVLIRSFKGRHDAERALVMRRRAAEVAR